MACNISKSSLPLSIVCVLFGFCTISVHKTQYRRYVICYCYFVTVSLVLFWTFSSVLRVSTVEYSFASVTYLIMSVVNFVMVTWYRVKCITGQCMVRDVTDSLHYTDQYLGRLGADVPHMRNFIVCIMFSAVMVCFNLDKAYTVFMFHSRPKVMTVNAVKIMQFIILVESAAFTSGLIFLAHFTFLLYMVKQRLALVCYVARNAEDFDYVTTVWSRRVRLSFVRVVRLQIKQIYCKNIVVAFYSTLESIFSLKKFYKNYLVLHFFITALTSAVDLFFYLVIKHTINSGTLDVCTTILCALPVILSVFIMSEVNNIRILITRFYWQNEIKMLQPINKNIIKWNCNITEMDPIFDCGYFPVGWALLWILFDFASLFTSAMLS